jgi:digeranylgeranylglycerophospholipid reductase
MQKYDIVVVGAGPAGLSFARVASAEAKVLVCEMQASVGGNTFSTWLPKEALPGELARAVVQRTKEVKVKGPKSELVSRVEGVVLDWKWAVRLLALEARRRGAEIWTSSPAKELLLKEGRVVGVRLEAGSWREEVRSEVVVDASGCSSEWSCLFSRLLGRKPKPEETVFTGEHLLAGAEPEDSVEFHFGSYLAPLGNGWVHPFGDGFAVAGIQGLRIHPEASLDEFVGRIQRLGRAAPVASTRGMAVDVTLDTFCSDGILAVGGACWHLLALSRGGLLQAMKAGEMAARVVLEALTEGDVSKGSLSEYERLWRRELGPDFELERALYSALSRSWDQNVERLLERMGREPSLLRDFAAVLAGVEPGRAAKKLLEAMG